MQNNPKQKAEEKQSKEYSKWKVCEKFTFLRRGKNFLHTHLHIYVSLCLNITKIQGIKIQTLKKKPTPKQQHNPNNNPKPKPQNTSTTKHRKCVWSYLNDQLPWIVITTIQKKWNWKNPKFLNTLPSLFFRPRQKLQTIHIYLFFSESAITIGFSFLPHQSLLFCVLLFPFRNSSWPQKVEFYCHRARKAIYHQR